MTTAPIWRSRRGRPDRPGPDDSGGVGLERHRLGLLQVGQQVRVERAELPAVKDHGCLQGRALSPAWWGRGVGSVRRAVVQAAAQVQAGAGRAGPERDVGDAEHPGGRGLGDAVDGHEQERVAHRGDSSSSAAWISGAEALGVDQLVDPGRLVVGELPAAVLTSGQGVLAAGRAVVVRDLAAGDAEQPEPGRVRAAAGVEAGRAPRMAARNVFDTTSATASASRTRRATNAATPATWRR